MPCKGCLPVGVRNGFIAYGSITGTPTTESLAAHQTVHILRGIVFFAIVSRTVLGQNMDQSKLRDVRGIPRAMYGLPQISSPLIEPGLIWPS